MNLNWKKRSAIDLNINAEPLEKALSMVLSGTGLSYKIKDRHIMIVQESKPVAQQRRVTGTVKDGNGEPIDWRQCQGERRWCRNNYKFER